MTLTTPEARTLDQAHLTALMNILGWKNQNLDQTKCLVVLTKVSFWWKCGQESSIGELKTSKSKKEVPRHGHFPVQVDMIWKALRKVPRFPLQSNEMMPKISKLEFSPFNWISTSLSIAGSEAEWSWDQYYSELLALFFIPIQKKDLRMKCEAGVGVDRRNNEDTTI